MAEDNEVDPNDPENKDGEPETTTPEGEGDGKPEPTAAEIELKKQLDDSESKRAQLHERLKKQGLDDDGNPLPKPAESQGNLTPMDVLVIQQAGVHMDDLEMVTEFAAFKKVSIADALKDETLKGIINTRTEERKTASATITGRGNARGTSDTSGEDLLRQAETTGEVPTTTEGMNKLFMARQQRRQNNARPNRK